VDSGRDSAGIASAWTRAVTLAETYHLDHEKAESEVELGGAFQKLEKSDEADLAFSLATATLTRIGGDPQIELRRDALVGLRDFESDRYAEAAALLTQAIERADEHYLDAPRPLSQAHSVLAFALTSLGADRAEEALGHARTAVAMREETLGPEHPLVASMLTNLAEVERITGHHEEALATVDRSLAIVERAVARGELPPAYSPLAVASWTRGSVLLSLGRPAEAVESLERARSLDRATGRTDGLVKDELDLATALAKTGRLDEAVAACGDARALVDANKGTSGSTLSWLLYVEAELSLARGKIDDAVSRAQRALAMARVGVEDTDSASHARLVLARALAGRGKEAPQARALAEQARDGFARLHDLPNAKEASALLAQLR
jgi:tetratricopeptide (TPR) repeat protein